MSPPLYRLESVMRRYNGVVALEIPDLSIAEGRSYILAGQNGAGKSTLLSLLALLLPPSEGTLYYRGEKVFAGTPHAFRVRREVTLLHQSPYLFDDTVFGNLVFGLAARGIRGEDLRRSAGRSLETVGLAGFERRKARGLSGGEAQRVAMARALALSPKVLLLDEPLANVDRETADVLQDVIASLPRAGTTVILATHGPSHPAWSGSELLRIANGRIDPPPQPGPEPANPTDGD
ncbi:MAG TPA: ABC transporter ATP-binding protein [Deltaproteobacteria bacterium]|nr:MAG: hypothetical protein A2X88_02735 [Deltaproteobacteria bacterium GWC2_65_14]HBO70324.1 ABC transporter ATP-binding protein [Deltaproteobacteria bacterium]